MTSQSKACWWIGCYDHRPPQPRGHLDLPWKGSRAIILHYGSLCRIGVVNEERNSETIGEKGRAGNPIAIEDGLVAYLERRKGQEAVTRRHGRTRLGVIYRQSNCGVSAIKTFDAHLNVAEPYQCCKLGFSCQLQVAAERMAHRID